MAIVYEINPPRTGGSGGPAPRAGELGAAMIRRATPIVRAADGVHVTDAVLGTRRLGVLESCAQLRAAFPDVQITMSLRTRDRTLAEVASAVARAAQMGVSGILLVRGDPAQDRGAADSDLYPGRALAELRRRSLTCGIRMLLSVSPAQGREVVEKKIASRPDGFITQVISSAPEAREILEAMLPRRIGVMPCVMLPSAKNAPSAESLGLDWSAYEQDPAGFVREIERLAGSVLVSSPRDLAAAESVIGEASRMRQDDAR